MPDTPQHSAVRFCEESRAKKSGRARFQNSGVDMRKLLMGTMLIVGTLVSGHGNAADLAVKPYYKAGPVAFLACTCRLSCSDNFVNSAACRNAPHGRGVAEGMQ